MELSAVDIVAELGYSARHSLRVGCKARHRMGALLFCWVSVSFVPQRCVAHRVQWHVAHPVLLAVSRHVEAKRSDIGGYLSLKARRLFVRRFSLVLTSMATSLFLSWIKKSILPVECSADQQQGTSQYSETSCWQTYCSVSAPLNPSKKVCRHGKFPFL